MAHDIKKIVAKILCISGYIATENPVNSIKKKLGTLHNDIEKKKYDVMAFERIKAGWNGVFQYSDNENSGPWHNTIPNGDMATNIIANKRIMDSINSAYL